MFKAKLISNSKYYKLRSKQSFLMLLPGIFIGILVNFYLFPAWVIALFLLTYILVLTLFSKNQKLLHKMLGQKSIEIDDREIRVKSKKGGLETSIKFENVEKFMIPKTFALPQETMKDFTKELTGDPKQNYLIVQYAKTNRRFDFEIDSHYMLVQLNKVIEQWASSGHNVARVA